MRRKLAPNNYHRITVRVRSMFHVLGRPLTAGGKRRAYGLVDGPRIREVTAPA